MNVILLDKIENLGNLGDKVTVRAGYARNFLIPGGKAKYATVQNIAEFEERRAELEKAAAETFTAAEKRREQWQVLKSLSRPMSAPKVNCLARLGRPKLLMPLLRRV